jgi:hypothetical protein
MNTSFDRLHLVNTYGAFGSVGRVRHEVILEGSLDGVAWHEIEFRCKPGDPMRAPCLISPLQPRLDWQIWFAAMQPPEYQAWLFKLVGRLLDGEQYPSLLQPLDPTPRLIRARLYEYHFTRWGEPGWWTRKLVREYFPPLDKKKVRQIAAEDD